MSAYDDKMREDPTGAVAAREADEGLEAAMRLALAGAGKMNAALESGKKYSWTLVIVIGAICGFVVRATLFFAEQSRFQESSIEFRVTTTQQLAALKETQDKADRANQEFKYAQIVTNNRLTDLADASQKRLDAIERGK